MNDIYTLKRGDIIADIPNPSKDASTTSCGKNLIIFFPTFVLAIELANSPVTFTTPERSPVATFSVILVTDFTLKEYQADRDNVRN